MQTQMAITAYYSAVIAMRVAEKKMLYVRTHANVPI
jgi:hypothetical protein